MLLRWLLAAMVLAGLGSLAQSAEPLAIGSRLEPLVDDYLVEHLSGAVLRLHAPTPREVAVAHDRPWEGNVCAYHTVFQDGPIYRMYYRGCHWDEKKGMTHEVICYAESPDGIRWTKPELGLVEFAGSKQNNIILGTGPGGVTHNFAPFKDANPACKPDEKYKALAGGPLYAYKSADGIHWSLLADKPVITKGAFDSQNLAFWDTVRGCYVEFHRQGRNGVRDIMTATTQDFQHWPDPVFLEYPGVPPEHLYTNAIAPYYRAPHIYFGFPKRFVPGRKAVDLCKADDGVSDGVFMTSRDGLNFHRWREALVRPGLQPERWVNRNNMTAWGILVTKSDIPGAADELSIYSSEHYYVGQVCKLRRFTQRIDGFVSVQAPLAGGEMVTKPIAFEGKQLVINFSTSAAGSIRVEIQNVGGTPIPGLALADSTEIYGDQLDRVVSWKGGTDLSPLAGKPIRLRFVMKDADLYSVQFK